MMKTVATFLVVFLALAAGVSDAAAKGAWRLTLPDTMTVSAGVVTLGDLATGPVPAGARDIVVRSGLEPDTVVDVSRQDVLRRLVTAGYASGVRLTGAETSRLFVSGRTIALEELETEVRRSIRQLVPAAREGAPASWFEFELPDMALRAAGQWEVKPDRNEPLTPGRNHVRLLFVDGGDEEVVTVTATFHLYGEVAVIQDDVAKNETLTEDLFTWQWRDLAEESGALAVGRETIQGCSAARDLKAGRELRRADLKETPVVLAGQTVDLRVSRGQVCVTVQAVARQDGCLGQNIPVKNELTGRLVNARVAGPGYVEWRK